MGDFKEHVIFGLLTAAAASYFLNDYLHLTQPEIIASSITIVIGSVLPDIDHNKAYVHRGAKAFASIGGAVLAVIYTPAPVHVGFALSAAVFLGVYIGFSSIKMKHRGFTHSLAFLLLTSIATAAMSLSMVTSPVPGVALGLGIGSHLVLDQHFSLS